MTIRPIDVGQEPNDETGDTLRDGGIIINENFAELDSRTSDAANKLATVQAGATKNRPDAELLARANHTGTQLAATISDFATASKAILQTYGLAEKILDIPEGQLNTLSVNSFAFCRPAGSGVLPSQDNHYVIHLQLNDAGYATQIALNFVTGKQYSRVKSNGTWQAWRSVVSGGEFGIGGNAPAPGGTSMNVRNETGIYGFAANYTGSPNSTVGGEYIMLQGAPVSQRATQLALSHDSDELWFRRDTNGWQPWKKLVMQGEYGVGATSLQACNDANNVAASGDLLVYPGTLNGPNPGVYGTIRTTFYEKSSSNWTQLILSTTGNKMFYRGCINGGIQPWMQVNEESITNSNGTAVKFSDGTMICWKESSTIQTTSNQVSTGVFLGTAEIFTFPVPFVTIGVVIASVSYSANAYCWGSVGEGNNPNQCRIVGFSHAANAQYQARYLAVGRWR
ncbi:pyocin knob domain-containing protein [Pseudomonas sp. CMR5c]|uniref:pyocin knob domain-containing protein n=1 Tax=Pseudomonas sp. CMR5c TaxID=658630 RepID=UPI000A72DACF|nr:pyocin knob domain-containing protein [Pseudomonas sp. CMR5c]AZC19536.1 L-shaped tail fiber protein [Pseudomonas sp. CMR5c]